VSGLIDSYVRELRSELDFDRALAERVCAEVEGHLADLAEAEGGGAEAERRAVARMGEAGSLAAGMAQAALPARKRRAWGHTALAALALFVAMRLRNVLIPVGDAGLAAAHVAVAVDRIAYWTAILAGAVGWLLAFRGDGTRGALAPVCTCAAALAISGAAGVYLLLLLSDGWSWQVATPALAASVATVVLGAVFVELLRLVRHIRSSNRSGGGEVARR
jgi:hypothetical protein